jgi:hypothetical protein
MVNVEQIKNIKLFNNHKSRLSLIFNLLRSGEFLVNSDFKRILFIINLYFQEAHKIRENERKTLMNIKLEYNFIS